MSEKKKLPNLDEVSQDKTTSNSSPKNSLNWGQKELETTELPESQQSKKTTGSDEIFSTGGHLDNIPVPDDFADIDGDGLNAGGVDSNGAADTLAPEATQFIGNDVFYGGFKLAFQVTGLLTGLATLKIAPAEEGIARPASDELYNICLETPALHFLVDPKSIWMKRAVVVAAFAVPKAAMVKQELRLKREAKEKAAEEKDKKKKGEAAEWQEE